MTLCHWRLDASDRAHSA